MILNELEKDGKMNNFIYTVVHCRSDYSDYCEAVAGVTDDYKKARVIAKKMADYVNGCDDWSFDDDRIKIRAYPLNEFRINPSEAVKSAEDVKNPAEYIIYEERDTRNGSKLLPPIFSYKMRQPVQAERFDGSTAMMKQYSLEQGDTGAGYQYYGDHLTVDEGEWILTDAQGNHWTMSDELFQKEFERCDE